jgi:parallel beta-helix repeat protein
VVILANTTPQTTAFVVSGGRLAGSGSIGALTATGTGVVAPGTSPGTIAAAGLSLATGTTLAIEIAGATAGTGYDQLVVGNAGTVDLGGATLSLPSSTAIAADTVLTIIDNQGSAPVTGTFQGLAEGATVKTGTQYFRLSYAGGTGNDVTLTAFDGDIIASVVNNELVLTLMTSLVIPDLHTTFDAVANTLAVTVANDGVMVSVASGVTIDAATDTIVVNLATVSGFAGIVVLGTSGTDQIVIGAGGIDLQAVTSGAANQSFRIDTAAGGDDSVTIAHAIRTKGAGAVSITSAGTGGAGAILIGAAVTAGGTQAYVGSVALTANATLAGTTVTTSTTLAGGGKALAITGNASLGGAVSGVTNLSVSGTTTLAGNVTTSGTQAYTGLVTLAADATLTGTTPTFTGGVAGGGHDLTLDFSGTTVITGAGFTGIRNLATGAGGGTTLSGALTTSGTQTYGDAVTLAANTTLTGTTPTFTGGVAGAGHDLTLDFSGTTVITGAGFTGIRNLATGNGGGTTLSGSITTSGTQTYGDAVTLAANTILAGTTPTFTGGVAGAGHDLTLDFSGTTVITGVGFTGIRNLATGAGGGTTLSGALTTSGTQAYGDAVTLADDATLVGTTVTTLSTLAGGSKALAITGNASLGGAVSGVTNLSVSGTTTLGANVTTSGTQAYTGLVTLAADATLTGTTPTFTGGVAGGDRNLTLNFSGTTVIVGAAFTSLAAITTDAAGSTTLSGSLTTSGTQTFNDDVTLAADTTLDAGTANIVLAGVVSGGFSLTPLTSGAGTTTLSGANTNTTTNVVSGVVILANTTPQTSAFLVSGGSLRGTGTIGTLTVTGTASVAPGTSPGTIGTSSLSLASGTTLQIEIAGATAGTGYDQLVVASGGAVDLTGATLALSATVAPPADTVLTIVDNQGPAAVTGTFAGLPEGATVTIDTQEYRISYVGGSGNDVTLTALQTDDIVVTVDGSSQVVLRLASRGVTISDLHTAYNASTKTLTITAVNAGTIFSRAVGITVNSAAHTITVDLLAMPSFAGLAVVGGNGTDSVTIGTGGVNLAAVAAGAAAQAFSIDTMAGAADAIVVRNPIIAKGAGAVALATSATSSLAGIRLSGAAVTTAVGSQTYGGPVVLASSTTLASGPGGDITFSGRLDGPQTLTVSAGGRVGFTGAVGGLAPLRGVTISKAAGVTVSDGFALNGAGAPTKADGLTIAAGVNNVVFSSGYTGGGRTFSGFGGSGIRLAGSSASSRLSGITSSKNGTGLRIDAGTYTDTTVTDSSFSGNATAGVSLANARGVAVGTTLAGNSITGNGNWGLYATGTLTGTRVQNNTIEGNAKYGVYLQAAAGLRLGGTAPNSGNRIVNAAAWSAYSTGVYATGRSTDTLIQGNTIQSNTGNGVMLVSATRITVGGAASGAGNLIAANGGYGITAGGTCTGSLIQGNTITGNAFGTVNVRKAKGIRVV